MIHTNLPEAGWPYKAELVLETRAAYHTGPDYVSQHFPDIPVEVIQRAKNERLLVEG